ALIAFVLLHLLHKMTKAQQGFLELVRLVRANLMHRKDATRLRQIQSPANRLPSIGPQLGKYMNRTAVGLTRVSIFEKHRHFRRMDCRVKPGNDGSMGRSRWSSVLPTICSLKSSLGRRSGTSALNNRRNGGM
ncbi:MAG: hypothetical protein ACXWVK_06700, partial [Rhodoplanes sp.]